MPLAARQTRSAVAGMAMSRTPRASVSALMKAGGEPMAPASPQPFTPSGLCVQACAGVVHREVGQVVGARHGVVHVRAGQQLATTPCRRRRPSSIAWPRPWAMPPCTWPSTIIGLTMLPKSSTAVNWPPWVTAGLAGRPRPRRRSCRRVGEVGGVVEGVLVQARLELVQRVVVRHVGGERHAAEGHLLVGAGDLELAVLELDVGVGRLQQVGGDLLALGDDLVHRLHDGRAAHGQRAAAVGAHAERHAAGVAVHDLDVLHRDAQLGRHHLRKGGLVALAVAVRTGEDGDRAGGVHAHLAGLEQARARAQRAGDVAGRQAAGLDVAAVAQPRSLPRLAADAALRAGKPATSAICSALSRCAGVVAGVVGQAHRRGVGEAR
jgi:hypothetical protein